MKEVYEMKILTQKIGVYLGLSTSPSTDDTDLVEQVIRTGEGVIATNINRDMPDVVEVEYDPVVTTPYRIYRLAMKLQKPRDSNLESMAA